MKRNIFAITVALLLGLLVAVARPAAADDDQALPLEAFGASFVLAVYNSQVIVGMAADSLTKNVYTKDEASAIIAEQKGFLDTLKQYVQKMENSPIAANESDTLQQMSDCVDNLQATIAALDAFMADSSQDNADKFEAKRQTSYNAIAKMLGLKQKQ